MRGQDAQQAQIFSYISAEERVSAEHPLRPIRKMVDEALLSLSPRFQAIYSPTGRPGIPPERLLRALLLQVLYTIRSERQLMEQLDFNILYRWFVGLNMDDPIWDVTVFTKNRDRLLEGDVAHAFFDQVLAQAQTRKLLSDEHFTVDGTLIEAWAGHKSFKRKDACLYRKPNPSSCGIENSWHRSWQERATAQIQAIGEAPREFVGKARRIGRAWEEVGTAIPGWFVFRSSRRGHGDQAARRYS